MRKTILILSVLALVASGCSKATKTQAETEIQTEEATQSQAKVLNTPEQETEVNDNSLEETILTIIKAYQKQDEETLNSLILKDFGIAFVYRPGIMDVFEFTDKISFSEPLPDGWTFDTKIITDYKIRFEKLPHFDCDEEKWNKPAGIYCDTKNKIETLSSIAKNVNEYAEGNFSTAEIKKLKEIEKKSHRVIVIGKKGNEFIFTVTFWENKWYLTIIERFEACSA